jgi:FkbH-like protein
MVDTRELVDALRTAVDQHTVPGPDIRAALARTDDPATLRRAGKVLADLRPEDAETDGDGLRPVRVAVLATCTIGPYEQLLRATLVAAGLLPTVEPGRYGMFEMALGTAVFATRNDDTQNDDAQNDPDVVSCLLDESYFLPDDWDPTDVAGVGEHIAARLGDLRDQLASATEKSSATILLHTLPLPCHVRDSVLSWRDRTRLARIWHQLNADLLGLADDNPHVVVVDLVSVLGDTAVAARDDRLHRYGDLPFSDGALVALANEVRRFVQARSGVSRKVLALDLDDTLWGGVLGEVGAEGLQLGGLYPGNCYTELQRTVARLRDQGVVLVLVSKNDAELVETTLTEHPEMLLRPDAFSATVVNWSAKAGNLGQAAETLGLATNSFVFLDDSAFERGHVEAELPDVAVLSAEGDPAHIVRNLLRHGWFDVLELTGTDRSRPEMYRARTRRTDFSSGFGSSEDYLRALEIELTPELATKFTVARIAQLAARTNQFNLTGIRYDEATTTELSNDPDHLVASFSVRDRFGDEGVIGAVWVDRGADIWQVTNLVLSCRVLGRGVETAVADWLVGRARAAGASTVEGRFTPSGRNSVAEDFWTRAGFHPTDTEGTFRLDAGDSTSRPDWISVHERSDALA